MRLFVFLNGDEVAALNADSAPRIGDALWIKTLDGEWSLTVGGVEHQLDRSVPNSNHDVCLYCTGVSKTKEGKTDGRSI